MKIKPIILAAGFGRRFGENKLLAQIKGKPMVCHVIDKAVNLSNRGVFSAPLVVTQYKEIENLCKEKNIDFIFNLNAEKGISTSIKTAVSHIKDADFYMFFTADQPFLKEETIENFVKAFKKSGAELGCVESSGSWGNPALFSIAYKNSLLLLEGDTGGKKILHRYKEKVFLFSVDKREVFDIDSKTDLE